MLTILFYGLLAVLALIEPRLPSRIWPILALAAFLLFLRALYRAYPKPSAILFAMTLTKILILLSLVVIAMGFWIEELNTQVSGPVYSFYFCLLACLFVHLSYWTFSRLSALNARSQPRTIPPATTAAIVLTGMILFGVVILALIGIGLTSGFALLAGVDRFVFRSESGWFFNFVVTSKPIMAAMLGAIRFRLARVRIVQLAIDAEFILFVCLIALFGDKFLSLIVLAFFYTLPALLTLRRSSLRIPPAMIIAGATLAVLVSCTTLFVYSDYGRLGWDATSQRLFGRATGQAQLWYAATQTGNGLLSPDGTAVRHLLATLGPGGGGDALDQDVGIFYLISRYAPANVYANIQAGSGLVQFTGGFEAYLLLIAGHLPMIVAVMLSGMLAGLACFYYGNSLLHRSIPGIGAAVFIYMSVYTMINQAAIWMALGMRTMIYAAVLVAIDLTIRMMIAGGRRPGPVSPRSAAALRRRNLAIAKSRAGG